MSSELVLDRKYIIHEFWSARPLLARVLIVASRTRKSAYSILGWLMVEVLTRIRYETSYVSEVGKASLNMLFLMSAPTGGGKSASRRVALEYFEFEGTNWSASRPIQLGSGEAGADSYWVQVKASDGKPEWVWVNPNHCRVFYNDEIAFHKGKAQQNSSTLEATYLSMYSGDLLGRSLAGGKGKEVPANEYRAVVVFNAQPENDPFRNDASKASGMPSRLLNLSATNPNARADYAATASQDLATLGAFVIPKLGWHNGDVFIPHQYSALPEMEAAHAEEDFLAAEGLREHGRSHTLLTRAKVACVLAALEGREHLILEDWHLAGFLSDHSTDLDESIQKTILQAQRSEAGKSGTILGVRMDAADAAKEEAALERVTKNLRKWSEVESYDNTLPPHEGNNPMRKSLVEKHFPSRDRDYLTEAFNRLYTEQREGGDK
jgi:hypothetical protein